MKNLFAQGVLMIVTACLLVACGASIKPTVSVGEKSAVDARHLKVMTCNEPRPEMCTREFNPVCGTKYEAPACGKGMICAAILLPSKKSYSNSCAACGDEQVGSYTKGECSAS